MLPSLTLATLLLPLALAVPCVQFDTSWNLYAFGGDQDVNLGQSSSWASPSAKPLTTSGRPPWTGNSTQCMLSQFNNAMYVLGGDASDLSKIYIYSFGSSSWSTQSTSSAPPNLGNSRSASVLDHDTNVVFTLPSGSGSSLSLYQLDMNDVKDTASSDAVAWEAVSNPSFSVDGYTPTAAQASNHISYFGVPNTAAGSANMFVVHFAYFQPKAQEFPTQNGGTAFPDSAGQAISIPTSSNSAPYQMVFVPNDFSSTYVVTHWTDPSNYATTTGAPFASNLINSTQNLPAPMSQDQSASYAASDTSLVQIDSSGNIYYITSAVGSDYTVASGATWTKMSYALAGTGGSNSTVNSASTSGSASAMNSGSGMSSGRASQSSGAAQAAGASAASGSSAAASPTGAASLRAGVGRWDVFGLSVGLVMLGSGLVS